MRPASDGIRESDVVRALRHLVAKQQAEIGDLRAALTAATEPLLGDEHEAERRHSKVWWQMVVQQHKALQAKERRIAELEAERKEQRRG